MITPTIRKWQFDHMEKSLQTIGHLVRNTAPQDATTYRDGGTGWTVVEVLGHLLDFEGVFLERARLTVEEDFPDLPFPDPDALVNERGYSQRTLADVYADFVAARGRFTEYLAGLPEEAWEREANHPRRGRFSLNNQLLLIPWHDMNHIEQMLHILAEKK